MKRLAQIASALALLGILVVAGLFFVDRMALEQLKTTMWIVTVVWFASAAYWMERGTGT
jgi:hypothetical protein